MFPKTILLIDDEPHLVFMLEHILTQEGYRVITANNGKEGLERLKKETPHLIILDMNMPKMGGIAFYEAITSQADRMPRYPIMVLTARANLEKLFQDLHIDGFLTKPFEISDLLKEVKAILLKKYGDETTAVKRNFHPASQKKILIIEDDKAAFERLVVAFVNRDYTVTGAHTGVSGVERAMREQPDLILIKLGLPDLPGDFLAAKLKQIPETLEIPLILYTPESENLEDSVTAKIGEKIGVRNILKSNDGYLLMKEVDSVFKNQNKAA